MASSARGIESKGLRPDLDIEIRSRVQSLSEQSGVHHGVVSLESLDGTIHWSGAFGDMHPGGPPMETTSRYWIASVTKLYIAASIFRLIEQKTISLDDPICNLLPEAMYTGIHRLNGADYTDMITVQHLLGHSSGLPDYIDDAPKGEPTFLDQVEAEDRSWTIAEAMQIVRERLTPHFPPQQLDSKRRKIRYSDTNYQLLIAILEHVTDKPLSEVFDELIYTRLGLTQTAHPEQLSDDQKPASIWIGDSIFDRPKAMESFRDLASTVDDQIRFMRGLVDGQLFEKPVTSRQLMGNWTSFDFTLTRPTAPSWPIQYGLGAMRFKIPRIFTPITPVPEFMGHTGVSGSWLFYCPAHQLVLAGSVDQIEAAAVPFQFVPRLLQLLNDLGKD
jgi:D-alanyl-D-alanine carboxypeptidase